MLKNILIILIVCASLLCYSLWIEPRMIMTQNYQFSFITKSDVNLKIIQISDTHLNDKQDLLTLNKMVSRMNRINPDFIVFTGDLVSDIRKFPYKNELMKLLKEMNAKRGKLAVYGNHDHGGYFTEQYEELLMKSNFILLKNEEKTFYIEKEKISFIGLDDYMLGNKQYDKILNRIQQDAYTIVLAHEPDIANITKKYPINLQLSGHSHGGQIYLPFNKSLIMPPYAKTYNRGVYQLSEQFERYLVVSNGIGTTKLPLRFLTPPEMILIEIKGRIKK